MQVLDASIFVHVVKFPLAQASVVAVSTRTNLVDVATVNVVFSFFHTLLFYHDDFLILVVLAISAQLKPNKH